MHLEWRFTDVAESNGGVHRLACRWAAVLLLAVVASGCGQDTGGRLGLSGTVRFQGAPLMPDRARFPRIEGVDR